LACHRASFVDHGLVARDGVDILRPAGQGYVDDRR
jgi:hypothetical protein